LVYVIVANKTASREFKAHGATLITIGLDMQNQLHVELAKFSSRVRMCNMESSPLLDKEAIALAWIFFPLESLIQAYTLLVFIAMP
jgi:hypothetical protein